MDQFTQLFQRLTWTQRIWLLVAAVAVIGGIASLSHWNQERDFKPLVTNLAAEDAGTLIAKLKESGFEYRLADSGSSILVPSARVAEARLAMAAEGLPKSGRIGFELFDKTTFGTNEFTEQVNYHRAIEGELERSIILIREVEQARVHVTLAKDSLYTEVRQPAKASVLVKLRTGGTLSAQNIAAICQLMASAVPELSSDQVSLVDTNGNLLNRVRRVAQGDDAGASDTALDYRKSVEKDLQAKIAATLEPLLGADHFRLGVSADVDMTTTDQSQETAVSGGRVVKHTKIPQGAVKRLSLSILVDHSLESPIPEKLQVIHNLVAAAAGLKPERGDELIVETFPFEATLAPESAVVSAAAPPAAVRNFTLPAALGAGTVLLLIGAAALVLAKKKAPTPPDVHVEELVPEKLGGEIPGFDGLQNADPQQLAKFIHEEHPQTIALILSHLNPLQAAGLLFSLRPEMRADVALRMANLDQVSPEIISKIAVVIGSKLKSVDTTAEEHYVR